MAAKRAEITTYGTEQRDEILNGTRKLLFLDECFLLWGDAGGYPWGKRNARHLVPIGNPQLRQPYDRTIDVRIGQLTVVPYDVADQASTTDCVLDLACKQRDLKLTICWDNASWHKGKQVIDYYYPAKSDM